MWEKKNTVGETPGWSWAYSFGISLNRRPYKTTVGLCIQTSHSAGIICPNSLYIIYVCYSIFKPPACELNKKKRINRTTEVIEELRLRPSSLSNGPDLKASRPQKGPGCIETLIQEYTIIVFNILDG